MLTKFLDWLFGRNKPVNVIKNVIQLKTEKKEVENAEKY